LCNFGVQSQKEQEKVCYQKLVSKNFKAIFYCFKVKKFFQSLYKKQNSNILIRVTEKETRKISRIFNTAQENKPSIVLIEDIDQIFPLK